MNLSLLIPDGVGVRNFLLGDFLMQFVREGERASACVLMPENLLANGDFSARQESDDDVRWSRLLPVKENPVSFTLRYSLAYAQMHWADTQAMRYTRRQPVKGSWRTRAAHSAARGIGRATASPHGIKVLDRWYCREANRSSEVGHYRQLFRQFKPSALFCSHQRPPNVLAPVLAARSLGVPTATFIFSWDNLTSKGRIAAPFDHFLVWSEHMRRELLRYYPDVSAERVHVVGTPQFDPYADASLLWSRDEFFRKVGADPSRALICYSGGDTQTCPEDPQHVRALLRLIRDGSVANNPQVLLRPAPVDDGGRYDEVRRDYPELIYAKPSWIHTIPGDWSSVIPLRKDIQFLANLTHHADLSVNLASTMTLDFALHDKPVVNVAFDTVEPPSFGVPLWDYFYKFEHYRPVVELGAARFARSPAELAQHVNAYLENPALDREARRQLVELEVALPLGRSTGKIIKVLNHIAREA